MSVATIGALTAAGIAMTEYTAICNFLMKMEEAEANTIKNVGNAVEQASR